MKLKTLMTAALTLLVAGLLSMPEPVEAKRFGGGGNVGKQYSAPQQSQAPRQAQTPNQTQSPAAAPAPRAPQTSGASRWLGPLAGLAAGGLLASLFMGDAFQGFQFMDFLLIVALGVGAFFVFRLLRRGRAAPAGAFGRVATAAAASGAYRRQGAVPAHGGAPRTGADQFPAWFDGPAFAEGAKSHFVRLQAAWDQGDFQDIRDYTTPQMFAEIQRERQTLGERQQTEVVRLQSELLGIQRDGDLAVASIRFTGLIREDAQKPAEAFSEIWHVQHPWASPQGDWLIAGIQQA